MPPRPPGLRTWIDIDCSALAHNVSVFRSLLGERKFCVVLKSNAYGHDFLLMAKELERLGVDTIAVDSITEALALREAGVELPLLVLGYTLPEMLPEAQEHDILVTCSSLEHIPALLKAGATTPIQVHIKVDTGMHRQGFLLSEKDTLLAALKDAKKEIQVSGLYTHFASAKNPSFPEQTKKQYAEFLLWRDAFYEAGFTPLLHIGATSGTLLFSELQANMARIGIGLYGLWPSPETEGALQDHIELKPVLSWRSLVSETKELPQGSKIGYEGTEVLWRDSRIGICPIGYWHGYPRALSSLGHVLVRGKRARVLGRVSMDMITVDLTDIPEALSGDTVTLIGVDGDGSIPAAWLASLIDMSPYELLTRLNPLIRRRAV